MFTGNQLEEKKNLDRRSSLKIAVYGNQSSLPAQKAKYPKQAKAAGLQSSVSCFTTRSLKCQALLEHDGVLEQISNSYSRY